MSDLLSNVEHRNPLDFKDKIISAVADAAAQKISQRVIATLQRMKEPLLSGDDTELANVWDEVCVQVQGEESVYWDAYEDTITQIIANEAQKLPEFVKQAIWLQTDPGFDWAWDAENEEEPGDLLYSDEELLARVSETEPVFTSQIKASQGL